MTASKKAKELGCKSLAQVSEQTGAPVPTLNRWLTTKPNLFEIVCIGVAAKLNTTNKDK